MFKTPGSAVSTPSSPSGTIIPDTVTQITLSLYFNVWCEVYAYQVESFLNLHMLFISWTIISLTDERFQREDALFKEHSGTYS